MIENVISSIKKNFNQLEEDLSIYNKTSKIKNENEFEKKNLLLKEINKLQNKLNELLEFKKSYNIILNDIYNSENELIEKKIENNINEEKRIECYNLINTLYFKINKYLFLISNWIEIYFGNNDAIFNKKDIPQINDLNFINFGLLLECLEKKRILINAYLSKLKDKSLDLKNEISLLKSKTSELEKANKNLKKEKDNYYREISNLNEKFFNFHKKLNIINDNNIIIKKEKENIFKIKNEINSKK